MDRAQVGAIEFAKLVMGLVLTVVIGGIVREIGQPMHNAATNQTTNGTALTGLDYTQVAIDEIYIGLAALAFVGFLIATGLEQ